MSEKEESRLVDEARRDVLLYRILSGKLEYGDSYIREVTRPIKEKGIRIYYQVLKDCIDVLLDTDIFIFLVETEQWSFQEQKKLEGLPREIENSKLGYFTNYSNPAIRKKNLIEINYKKEEYKRLFIRRNRYYNLTGPGIAQGAMWQEMIGYMYKGEDKLLALRHFEINSISEEDIRDIALDDEWLSYYAANKNVFGKAAIKMTEDQRRLMTWTNMYKNCRSSPDCPATELIKDHNAFDGWLIQEQRKTKATKKMDVKGVDPRAQNVYFFGNTKEDLEEIDSLNTPEAKRKIENEFAKKRS